MGKPTGFMEYEREVPVSRSPLERIKDFNEFYQDLPEESLKKQGARCMNCGVPYCHTGEIVAGVAMGCPLNNLIPEWNDLVYRGLWKEAFARLMKTNNFPEFTGRVCPAPCEGSCTVSLNQQAVTIKNIEKSIIEKAYEEGWITPKIPAKRSKKAVAVIGSGPAGLACADELNKAGHLVTVYERDDRPGGLLMYGIPNMKLDKNMVLRRVKIMEEEGIQFVNNFEVCEITAIVPANRLRIEKGKEAFDAVVLCCGAKKPRDLIAEGRDLEGVHLAVDFLTQSTRSLLDSERKDGKYLSAKDKDVVVIGGGDTGTDCVATSIRHGCKSVVQLEIMPKPLSSRQDNNPWPQWPKIQSTDYGQQEAAAVFGKDPRKYATMIKKIIGDLRGNVEAVETSLVEWIKDESGRVSSKEIPSSTKIIKAQMILIAMGFTGPEDDLLEQLSIERDGWSNVKTEQEKYATNRNGIFAAGDVRRGQSLVVWAIDEGRRAAKECNKYLM